MLHVFKDVVPSFTSGILAVVLCSCALFGIQTLLGLREGAFSVGSSVFESWHLHRLVLYPFYHRNLSQLIPSIIVLVFLSGSLEKGIGTVRFLFLFVLLSASTGLLYAFVDLLQTSGGDHTHAEGLVPVALACVAVTTMHTKMTKGFLCGVSFPTMVLPWVFVLATSVLVPHSVLPCNIIATLVGWLHGKGWLSFLEMSEARAAVLEKMLAFRMLRSISAATFVPASTEERRKTLLPQINPTPGSYPVQAYAPLSSINAANSSATMYEGWVHSAPSPPLHPHAHGLTHGSGKGDGHSLDQNFGQSCNHNHPTHTHAHP